MYIPRPLSIKEWRASGGPDYRAVFAWRQAQLEAFRQVPDLLKGALHYYASSPSGAVDFICHWVDTYDPRNAGQPGKLARMPFIMFERQAELIELFEECRKGQESALIEKCRDAGVTWLACGYSVWAWRFVKGASVGWGSRKEQLVDKIGDMDSIFEKMRQIIHGLPSVFYPKGFNPNSDQCMSYMRIINPEHGASITGEAGDNIGRGGRKLIYFKDESAHYARPELVEAALSENTRSQIDISSVNGTGNPFHRRREAGQEWSSGKKIDEGVTRVFIFDVFDHPEKTQKWYDTKKYKFESEGLAHIFAQEVDRNYAAAVEGILIQPEWVQAAFDAHIVLGIEEEADGDWLFGLDVADDGPDKNAIVGRKGIVLRLAKEWGARDPGVTARHAIDFVTPYTKLNADNTYLQYDAIGVGAAVKSEVNRLNDDGLVPEGLVCVPWFASANPLQPHARIIEGDKETKKNIDFFDNIKAQGWWRLSMRFYRTWQAVTQGIKHDPATLISIHSGIDCKHQLTKELSQATRGLSGRMRMIVNKAPDGTKSPNIADGIVEAYNPIIPPLGKIIMGTTGG